MKKTLLLLLMTFVLTSISCSPKEVKIIAGRSCLANLKMIDGAKDTWALEAGATNGKIVLQRDLLPLLREFPECPQGGSYTIGAVGARAKCSHPARSSRSVFFRPSKILQKSKDFDPRSICIFAGNKCADILPHHECWQRLSPKTPEKGSFSRKSEQSRCQSPLTSRFQSKQEQVLTIDTGGVLRASQIAPQMAEFHSVEPATASVCFQKFKSEADTTRF